MHTNSTTVSQALLSTVMSFAVTREFLLMCVSSLSEHLFSLHRFEFYLVPQAVNQGTVTPIVVNVVSLDADCEGYKLRPRQIQLMTYKMTHMYYNWQGTLLLLSVVSSCALLCTGTIRVPAPLMFAHKLAYQVSQTLHFDTDNIADSPLADKLFYL